jgi:hypothetical protein
MYPACPETLHFAPSIRYPAMHTQQQQRKIGCEFTFTFDVSSFKLHLTPLSAETLHCRKNKQTPYLLLVPPPTLSSNFASPTLSQIAPSVRLNRNTCIQFRVSYPIFRFHQVCLFSLLLRTRILRCGIGCRIRLRPRILCCSLILRSDAPGH